MLSLGGLIYCFFLVLLFPQGRVDGVSAIVGNNIIIHSEVLQQAQFIAIEKKIDPTKSPYLFEDIYVQSYYSHYMKNPACHEHIALFFLKHI